MIGGFKAATLDFSEFRLGGNKFAAKSFGEDAFCESFDLRCGRFQAGFKTISESEERFDTPDDLVLLF